MVSEREHADSLLAQAMELKVDKSELAWITIAHAQTHATLALVDAVKVLTEIIRDKGLIQ